MTNKEEQAPHPLDALRALVTNAETNPHITPSEAVVARHCLALATEAIAAVERRGVLGERGPR